MKPITQENEYGCGIACVAFLLNLPYQETLRLVKNGETQAENKGFYCRELVKILNLCGRNYDYAKIDNENIEDYNECIVFIKKDKKYPDGHYLVRINGMYMDPWLNLCEENPYPRTSGFRDKLPGTPEWFVFKIESI